MFGNNSSRKLAGVGYKVFEFFNTSEFLRFNGNSRGLFFRDSLLLNGFDHENPQLIEQIRGNLRWLFNLNALKVEFSGSDAGKFFKSLNFFFSTQRQVWNQYYGGRFFFLQSRVRLQVFSNFSAIGVFFNITDIPVTGGGCSLNLAPLGVGSYGNNVCFSDNDESLTRGLKIYRNPFFFKFETRALPLYSDYFNIGFDNSLNFSSGFGNFLFFFTHVQRDLRFAKLDFCFLRQFRNLQIQLMGGVIGQMKLMTSFVLPINVGVYRYLAKNLIMLSFLEFVNFNKLGFFLVKWVHYFKRLVLFLEFRGHLVRTNTVPMRNNALSVRYSFLKNRLSVPISRQFSNLFRLLAVKNSYLSKLVRKKGRCIPAYWVVRLKIIDVDAIWKMFFLLRRKFWFKCGVVRLVRGGFYTYKFRLNLSFNLLKSYKFFFFLLGDIFFNLRIKGFDKLSSYIRADMVLNIVHDLFYVAVNAIGLFGGSVFFYKRLLSESADNKLPDNRFLNDMFAYSETRLVGFYAFTNFSNYEYLRVALSQSVNLNWLYTLPLLIRHFRNFVVKRTRYLGLLQRFFLVNAPNDRLIGVTDPVANGALFHFFRLCTSSVNRSPYFGDSFYKLLFAMRGTRIFYYGLSENEIFYSSSQGILHLVRAGVSRTQYNFFFLYSFLERKANVGFFRKLGGVSSGSNSLRFASGLKKFDSSFFNNISTNMLRGFSELSALGVSETRKTAVSSKQFDVSKFFFLGEFSDSSFFNSLSGSPVLMNFSVLEDFTRLSPVLNGVCWRVENLTSGFFEKLLLLKLTKWRGSSLCLTALYGDVKLRCLFFEI